MFSFRSTDRSVRFRSTPQTFLRSPSVTASRQTRGRVGSSPSVWTACCSTSATLRRVPAGSAAVTRTSPNVSTRRPRSSRRPARAGVWSLCGTSRRWGDRVSCYKAVFYGDQPVSQTYWAFNGVNLSFYFSFILYTNFVCWRLCASLLWWQPKHK